MCIRDRPSYDQKTFSKENRKNKIVAVASGYGKGEELYIHQDAMVSLGQLDKEKSAEYSIVNTGNGAYLMVISGQLSIDGKILNKRDAIGINGINKFNISANENTEFLIVDVPMK